MSSLCLLSVDDVYEQDGLAAECLMVHKIKPRLSAAQRLPSGSHVVEACWEYKFRAHGQVNAPPPSPRAPLPLPGPAGPTPPAWGRQRGPRLPHNPARTPAGGRLAPGSPSSPPRPPLPKLRAWIARPPGPRPPPGSPPTPRPQPWKLRAPLPPLLAARQAGFLALVLALRPASLSLGRISWGSCLSVCHSASQSASSPPLSLSLSPASPCLCVCPSLTLWLSQAASVRLSVRASVRLARSPWVPLSPLSPLSRRWRPPHCSAAPAVYDKNIILLLLNNPINLSTGRKLTSCLFG